MKNLIIKLSVVLIIFAVVYTDFNTKQWEKPTKIIEWDVISYYAYLPACFIYNDMTLKFKDNYAGHHKFVFWGERLPNGNYLIKTTMGLSVMYSPFFFVANSLAGHLGYDTGGYSLPYRFAIVMAALFYLALGLLFLTRVLRFYFSEKVTALTILAVGLGTNLFWYSTFEPGMSHVYTFALVSVFLYLTILWYRRSSLLRAVFLGLVIGLLTLIRPVNVLFVLFFIFYDIKNLKDIQNKLLFFWERKQHILLMVLFGFLMLVPQFLYWKTVTGHWIYYSYGKEGFFFLHPQIINVLFSFRKGWFVYTPIMLFAVIGIFFLRKNLKRFAFPTLTFLIVYLYVVSSWWCWWYGGSLGQRELIDIYPVMALPLAAMLQWVFSKKAVLKYIAGTLLAAAVVLGIFYNVQYYYGSIHWDSMTQQAYFNSFGRVHPSQKFYRLIKSPDYKDALIGKPEKLEKTMEKQERIDEIIRRIESDKKWFNLVKQKALKSNISVDSMLHLDARYVLDHEK